MSHYPIHTIDSAPEASKPVLEELQQTFGFIPNIAGAMAESSTLISAFLGLFMKVHSGRLSEAQIQILLLTNAVTNACPWAAAFHSFLALKQGIEPAEVQAIRERRLPADPENAALSQLTKTLIEKRGHASSDDLEVFAGAGFDRGMVFEVIAVLAASTITNYVGSIAEPPLEEAFREHSWTA